jgi:hypothetical protein
MSYENIVKGRALAQLGLKYLGGGAEALQINLVNVSYPPLPQPQNNNY